MIRLLIAALAGFAAGLFEVSITPFLPTWAGVRPLLPLITILLVSTKRSRVAVALLCGTLVFEAYRVSTIDLPIVRLALVVFCMDLVARRFLTNRSVYATVALAWFGRLLDFLSLWLLSMLLFFLGIADAPRFWQELPLWTVAWDGLLVCIGFFGVALFSRRFLTMR